MDPSELFERVPEELRLTLTWDQGTELARLGDLAAAVGIDVFFAEPHSRGSVRATSTSTANYAATSAREPISPCTPSRTST